MKLKRLIPLALAVGLIPYERERHDNGDFRYKSLLGTVKRETQGDTRKTTVTLLDRFPVVEVTNDSKEK